MGCYSDRMPKKIQWKCRESLCASPWGVDCSVSILAEGRHPLFALQGHARHRWLLQHLFQGCEPMARVLKMARGIHCLSQFFFLIYCPTSFSILWIIWLYPHRSQWPRALRRKSAAARLLRLWARIPSGMDVCCECCVLSGRGLCDGLIARPEESYRLWRVVV
jgi:hypothetical protein